MSGETPADEIPDVFARWVRSSHRPDEGELPKNEIPGMWKHLTGLAEREFWRSLDAAQEPPLVVRDFLTGRELSVEETTHGYEEISRAGFAAVACGCDKCMGHEPPD